MSVVHLHCGDSSAESMRKSSLPGVSLAWFDLLHEGQIPEEPFDSAKYLNARAEFLASTTGGAVNAEACLRHLKKQDDALANALNDAKELVLWFDACLYDQTILARQLKWLLELERRPAKLSLVCIGEFPGKKRFLGLGELNSGEMASLFPSRAAISEAMLDAGRLIWEALCGKSPEKLLSLANRKFPELPFMAEALGRYLLQCPSLKNGLPSLDEEILLAIEKEPQKPLPLFKALLDMEQRPYYGDTTVWRHINALAGQSEPLLRLDGPGALPSWNVKSCDLSLWQASITENGRRALKGELDNVNLNGVDLELGGLAFKGRKCLRFDHENRAFSEK